MNYNCSTKNLCREIKELKTRLDKENKTSAPQAKCQYSAKMPEAPVVAQPVELKKFAGAIRKLPLPSGNFYMARDVFVLLGYAVTSHATALKVVPAQECFKLPVKIAGFSGIIECYFLTEAGCFAMRKLERGSAAKIRNALQNSVDGRNLLPGSID